jgi:hypothetical protein
LLSSYKGLPNVLIVMFALIAAYAFITSSAPPSAGASMRWAAMRRRRGFPASTPNG